MSERYWEPKPLKEWETIKDWVSENVEDALCHLFEECTAHLMLSNGRIVVEVFSLEKPDREDLPVDVFNKKFDLSDMAVRWSEDYDRLSSLSDEQRADLKRRADLFEEIAARLREKADR